MTKLEQLKQLCEEATFAQFGKRMRDGSVINLTGWCESSDILELLSLVEAMKVEFECVQQECQVRTEHNHEWVRIYSGQCGADGLAAFEAWNTGNKGDERYE